MVVGYNSSEFSDHQLSSIEHSSAGFASGFFTRIIIQPLDVLKIRFQLQEEPLRRKSTGKYRNLIQSISLIYKEEGLRAFWKGHVPAQGLSAVYGLIQFTAFEFLSKEMKPHFSCENHILDFVCGAIAGCSATTCAMPLDVVRTRLVAQGKPRMYKGSIHAFCKIWLTEGYSGFFRGLLPSLYQIFPFAGLQFMFYNFFNGMWCKSINEQGPLLGSFGTITSGFLAGTISKTIVYPLDLVRHRFQINAQIRSDFVNFLLGFTLLDALAFVSFITCKTTAYRSVLHALLTVVEKETLLGLFKGLSPSLLKTGSSSALSFFFYELICDLFRSIHMPQRV